MEPEEAEAAKAEGTGGSGAAADAVQAGRHQRHTRSKPEERPRPKGINQQCRLGWTTRHRCDGSLPVRSKPLPHRWRAAAVVMGRLSRLKVIAVNVCVLSAVVCFAPARTVF